MSPKTAVDPRGLPVTCPKCDRTLYAKTAADIDVVVAAHDRVCPGVVPSKNRRSITCPQCGKVLATDVGTTSDVAAQTELLLTQHTCRVTPSAGSLSSEKSQSGDPSMPRQPKPPRMEEPRLEDPPPPGVGARGNARPELVAARDLALANPGRWVRVGGNYSKGTAGSITKGKPSLFRDGNRWDAAERITQGAGKRRVHVWIRTDSQPSPAAGPGSPGDGEPPG